MATNNKIKIVSTFADDTSRDIEFSGFDSDADALDADTLRQRIKNLNSDTAAFDAFYISDGGAAFSAITGATISKVTETDIPLHNED